MAHLSKDVPGAIGYSTPDAACFLPSRIRGVGPEDQEERQGEAGETEGGCSFYGKTWGTKS